MDRDRLAQLLDTTDEAFIACRRAVLAGARFWVNDREQPAFELYRIYRRRDRHTQERGISSVGFTAAVDALHAVGEQPVLLGAVDIEAPPYHFQLFFNADATAVVACLRIDQSWRTQPRGTTRVQGS